MAIIDPKPKSLSELIYKRRYEVPLYQRPYDWETDNVSELWDDILKNDPNYFLGTVLFMPKTGNEQQIDHFEIVDGQQRFTTLILLLRAAVETLEKIGEVNLAKEYQREYIDQKSAGESVEKVTLRLSKLDRDKFESLILGKTFSKRPARSSWKNLDKTLEFFKGKFEKLGTKEKIVDFLNKKVSKISFIEIQLGTESDVYQFFETLNDRGMALSIADLVKNRVCAEAVKQNMSVEDSVLSIDGISDSLKTDLKAFLLHYCWANGDGEETTPRKELMSWYINHINNSGNIKEFLDKLELYASYYKNFVDPERCDNAKKKIKFTYLDALGATRCYPLLLAGEKFLQEKDFLKLCDAVEILTFRHSTILKRDAKVLEGFFFGLIKDIKAGKPIRDILDSFKFQDAMKQSKQFDAALEEFVPANPKLARYVLLRIEEHLAGKKQVPFEWRGLTLEHILAEKHAWDGRETYLQWLGNLTLLSAAMNDGASNKPFLQKRAIYGKEKRLQLTKELLEYADFTKEDVLTRQKKLADYAKNIWSLENIK